MINMKNNSLLNIKKLINDFCLFNLFFWFFSIKYNTSISFIYFANIRN